MPDTHNRNQRWVADVVTEDVLTRDQLLPEDAPAGFWGTAWRNLRRRPMFWVSTVIILAVLLVTVFVSARANLRFGWDFGGILVPTTTTQRVMGMEQIFTISDVNYEPIDPAVFELPKEIQALIGS